MLSFFKKTCSELPCPVSGCLPWWSKLVGAAHPRGARCWGHRTGSWDHFSYRLCWLQPNSKDPARRDLVVLLGPLKGWHAFRKFHWSLHFLRRLIRVCFFVFLIRLFFPCIVGIRQPQSKVNVELSQPLESFLWMATKITWKISWKTLHYL